MEITLNYEHTKSREQIKTPLLHTAELETNMGEKAQCEFHGGKKEQKKEINKGILAQKWHMAVTIGEFLYKTEGEKCARTD